MCRNALEKFRLFLRQERGQVEISFRQPNYARYCANLPEWLVEQLERYCRVMQHNWRPARLCEATLRFWSGHTRPWRWLYERFPVTTLADIRRQYILDYVDHLLSAGYGAKTINQDLRHFHGFLVYLQTQDFEVPQSLLRIPGLREPDSLPRFLADEQVRQLRDEFEQRLATAGSSRQKRDALFDRAAFYLLWQGGLRLGETEELRLEDLDLTARKLIVRRGKGLKDRTVYLTDTVVQALKDYLPMRGMGPTSHVFLYRNLPVHKDLIGSRIRTAGERAGIKVSPHRLRHTCATQLLNAGCQVTSIQKLLGHRRLNSTMIYARVHDQTVAEDYFTAMARIEGHIEVFPLGDDALDARWNESYRTKLLDLASRLAQPELSAETRLNLVAEMRAAIDNSQPIPNPGSLRYRGCAP